MAEGFAYSLCLTKLLVYGQSSDHKHHLGNENALAQVRLLRPAPSAASQELSKVSQGKLSSLGQLSPGGMMPQLTAGSSELQVLPGAGGTGIQ